MIYDEMDLRDEEIVLVKTLQSVEEYIQFLKEKGFVFREKELGFISFGKKYAGANDTQVNIAIEITLKGQRKFDGSYFIALLEHLKVENINDKKLAFQYAKQKGILSD